MDPIVNPDAMPLRDRIATIGAVALGRRHLLKSGTLIAASASMTAAAPALAATRGNGQAEAEAGPGADRRPLQGGMQQGLIGFMLAHEQFTLPELVQLGAAAELAGFDLLATSDHLQPWQDNQGHAGAASVTLGALSQRTRSAWMGPTVTCPTFRYNPAVVAETFASLSQLSPGRIFLGLGSGEALNEQVATGAWPNWQERSERLIEATALIRELWRGEQVKHAGRYYQVDARLYDKPVKPIPILLAANGPKAMRRAGQYGDGLITDPATWKEHKGEFEQGLKIAGKKLGEVPVLIEQFVTVGEQRDAATAAQLWRFLPKAFKGYHNIPDPREIRRRAEAELPLEKVYGEWTVSLDPEVHAKKIRELFASGATIVNVHSGQPEQSKVVEFYGRQVLPLVRKQVV